MPFDLPDALWQDRREQKRKVILKTVSGEKHASVQGRVALGTRAGAAVRRVLQVMLVVMG